MTAPSGSDYARNARAEKRRLALEIGIDESYVAKLVDRFYARVRTDSLIGPIFEAHVDDWDFHLAQLKRFWRSILFSSGEYLGSPIAVHLAIGPVDETHFGRWLELFDLTLRELGSDEAAEHVHARARTIAKSLLHGIEASRTSRREASAPT